MQPKPIDSRRLLDIDAQKRTVDMEGMQHLRSVSEHKEHPAQTDYDVVHDEEGRHRSERSAEQFAEQLKKLRAKRMKKPEKSAEEEALKATLSSENGKGARLDVEA
jgi:hypothetical protein